MTSPLMRRLPRQLVNEFGKYLGIFLLLVISIALVAGFLVAASSIELMVKEMPERYAIEDARLTTAFEADESTLEKLASESDATITPLFSLEDSIEWTSDEEDEVTAEAREASSIRETATVRLYENRTDINQAAYAEGEAPATSDEIALDRVFCANHDLTVGDSVQLGDRTLVISGIMTLADYSALFVENSDFVFDSLTFTVAQITPELFEALEAEDMPATYTYAITFDDRNMTQAERIDAEKELMERAVESMVAVTDFVDREANQAISYAGSDVEGDQLMWKVLLILLLVIMAFVFVVLTSSTIEDESAIIGTLLASGYRKGELVRHYLALPTLVGVAAALVGNVLGYTVMATPMKGLYYNSYSLPPYEAHWNTEVFILTTVVPLVLLIGITALGLIRKLGYAPLRFLRHDISKTGVRAQVRLSGRLKFATRFRIRIFLRNLGNFVTLFFGITFASLLLLFGLCMMPVVENYADGLKSDLVAEHQYVLKMPVELGGNEENETDRAPEKYAATSLETAQFMGDGREAVSVFGIESDSEYWTEAASLLKENLRTDHAAAPIVIGRGLADKAGLAVGDVRSFTDPLTDETYEFQVVGFVASPSSTNVFMTLATFNQAFDQDPDYFNGYVSDRELDLDKQLIASDLTPAAMDRIVAQMNDSMGSMTSILLLAAALVYVVLMYLLTKTVIDRSAQSIAYMKVFGYRNGEVDTLYIRSVTETVVVSLVASLPLIIAALSALLRVVFLRFSGNFTLSIAPQYLVLAVVIGLACYALVALLHLRAIRRVPLTLALKAQE